MKGTIISPSFISSSLFSPCSLLPEAQETTRGGHRSACPSPGGSSAVATRPPPGPGEASGCKEEAQGIGAPALGVWGQRAGLSPLGLPSGAV